MSKEYSNNAAYSLTIVGVFGALMWWTFSPSELEMGHGSTLVTLRSRSNGKYVEVSPIDGMLRTASNKSTTAASRFRMMTIPPTTVARLRSMHETFERASNEAGRDGKSIHTRSGCKCTGFSSEHGFGRYCHAWEEAWQDSWCYVADTCDGRSVNKGSFGRRHDLCTSAPYPSPPPSPPPLPPSPPPPPSVDPPPPFDPLKARGVWIAPAGCACSGFSNKHGFGAYCAPWERKLAPTQVPWCYVDDNCTAAARRGSFGRAHADCVLVPAPPPPPAPKRRFASLFGRRLSAFGGTSAAYAQAQLAARKKKTYNSSTVFKGITGVPLPVKRVTYPTKKETKSHAHEREEAVLLKKVDRLRRKYVAFVSEATHGFLTVEMPPHTNALHPTALTDKLSLQAVFALLPSGHIAALGTNALLNLCDPKEPSSPSPYSNYDRYRNDVAYAPSGAPPPPAAASGSNALCTGYHAKKGDAHYKLLRVTQAKTAEFSVIRV